MFFKRKNQSNYGIHKPFLPLKKKRKNTRELTAPPTVITTSHAGWVKAEAAQTDKDTLVSLHPSQYLAVQEKVVWFDVSVDESKLVNRVYG